MADKPFTAVDLFAGAGGMSTGAAQAVQSRGRTFQLVAVNHWPTAIATHTVNHPTAVHVCAPIEGVFPPAVVPGGSLDLLLAAPECTHHSSARGGRPMNDQSRASAWHILRWLELLRVKAFVIENVPEFAGWARLGANGRPIKAETGRVFAQFLDALRAYGFTVEHRELVAADYGGVTTRRRLFIVGVRGVKCIPWPAPTHAAQGVATLFDRTVPWRAASELLDWTQPVLWGSARSRPFSAITQARIDDGLARFGGAPFVLGQQSGGVARPVTQPLPTIATGGALRLVVPQLGSRGRLVDVGTRWLTARELAAAMSFPSSYQFAGTTREQLKQIGNAVDCAVSRALVGAVYDATQRAHAPAGRVRRSA